MRDRAFQRGGSAGCFGIFKKGQKELGKLLQALQKDGFQLKNNAHVAVARRASAAKVSARFERIDYGYQSSFIRAPRQAAIDAAAAVLEEEVIQKESSIMLDNGDQIHLNSAVSSSGLK